MDVFAYFDCYVVDVFVHLDCDVYVDCYVYVDSTSTSTSSSSSTGTLRQQQCQQEQQQETCNSRGSSSGTFGTREAASTRTMRRYCGGGA